MNSPFQTRTLETATTFANETDGEWHLANWNDHGNPDLFFIKTSNTPSGNVEVHIASAASNFQTRILETPTTFANSTNGAWMMYDVDRDGLPDLVFIMTSGTASGKVEIHVASGKSNFQTRILETATTFDSESDGTWTLTDWNNDGSTDLVFLKTSNTPSGNVEVHIASGKSNYQTRILETATTFANDPAQVWLLRDVDEDHKPDLVQIKTSDTPGNVVEVHVASGASNFQTRVLEVGTTFGLESDGVWRMASFNATGVSDLVFLKTANTPNGHVEVHVAAGWLSPAGAAAVAAATQAAALAAAIQATEVSGIRVHNTGAFEMSFSIGGPNDSQTPMSATFGVGDSRTISMALTPGSFSGSTAWSAGASICPVAHIQDGASNHGAGQNVNFNPKSTNVAIYNCGGTTYTPSFSFQENSSDTGSNAGLPGLESDDDAVQGADTFGDELGMIGEDSGGGDE